MKHCFIAFLTFCITTHAMAQVPDNTNTDNEEEVKQKGFKKENLFAGGTVALGFGTGSFNIGLGPYFGYSINRYVDVALSVNYNYISQRDFNSDAKFRQSVLGPGAFVRLYPVKFLFAHAQYEQNFIQYKFIADPNTGQPNFKENQSVGSILVGPGFASGREVGNNNFYYISLLFDVAKNINSPYVDQQGRLNPIFRAGLNVALFQSKAPGGYQRRNRQRPGDRF